MSTLVTIFSVSLTDAISESVCCSLSLIFFRRSLTDMPHRRHFKLVESLSDVMMILTSAAWAAAGESKPWSLFPGVNSGGQRSNSGTEGQNYHLASIGTWHREH